MEEDIENVVAENLEITGSVHDYGSVTVNVENLYIVRDGDIEEIED